MSKHWEPCPRCGSNKVTTLGKWATFLVLIGTGSCLFWVGFLFPFIWIFAGLLILVSPVSFFAPKMNQCKDCKKSWKAGHAEEYKKAISDVKKATQENLTEEITATEETVEEHGVEHNETIKTFSFQTVGLNFEGRRKILTNIINQYKADDWFFMEPYEGMTNKEILEESFGERIYELVAEGLPYCEIEKEDDNEYDPNALKILVQDVYGGNHHIGYVPKEHCKEIRKYIDNYRMKITTTIVGGKYKVIDYDDMGEEKVRTRSSDYGLDIFISFQEHS